MWKKITVMLVIISIIVVYLLIPNNKSESFNFSLRYGVDGRNFVSTTSRLLDADTVEGQRSVDFEFTEDDLKRIKDKVIELEIMEIDFREMPKSDVTLSIKGIYKLDIELDGETKSIYWTTENAYFESPLTLENENDEERYEGDFGKAKRLFDLKNFILMIIKEYDEYKELPTAPIYL